jgi:HK97 family phage prohead protease
VSAIANATPGLEYKATTAAAGQDSALLGADDQTGVVEAIVSVTGVVDNDHDIIEPGAYKSTLVRRRPKGIFSHDWGRWAAKTEEIVELLPGDARLPKTTRAGGSWPAEAGGLYVKARYNLNTPEGRSAYENVKFFGDECEWSIGYKVPSGRAVRGKDGVRRIKEVDLYEYSPVLFGSASLSGTLSVKAQSVVEESKVDDATFDVERAAEEIRAEADAESDEDSAAGGEKTRDEDGGETDWEGLEREAAEVDTSDDIEPPVLPEVEPGQREEDISEASEDGEGAAETAESAETGEGAVEGTKDDGGGGKSGPPKSGPPKSGSGSRATTPGGDTDKWKIRTVEELRAAVRGFGAVKDSEKNKIRAHIMKRAFALNRPDLIPKDWKKQPAKKDDGDWSVEQRVLADVAAELETEIEARRGVESKGSAASLNRSPRKNWVENTGELPGYVREVARSIHEKRGIPLENAIPIAIAQIKKWAAGGDGVNADTRAKAAKALAQWEALKARNAARSGKSEYDPGLEVGPDAGHQDPPGETGEAKRLAHLPGTYEELRDRLHEAAHHALAVDTPYLVEVLGTWPGRAVVTRYSLGDERKAESFEIDYGYGEESVTLGEAVPVDLTVEHDGQTTDGASLLPHPAMLESVADEIKSLLVADDADLENKAGRVLSGVNANRLKSAVEQLVAVLKVAGIEIATPDTDKAEEERPREQDSTAPSVRGEAVPAGKILVDPRLHARAYRILGEVYSRA